MQIDIQNIHFTYPSGVPALQGVSCSIPAGEQLAIVGQNGSGKTTLVKHLNGLLKPNQGQVLVGGWETTEKTVAQMASRVGYVFQNPDEQLFTKTVYQETLFGPKNLGYDDAKCDQLVEQALETTGLRDEKDTNPYDLSPTWRKMVAVASIIAMDTPTTGQDAGGIARIGEVVELLQDQGKTVIAISHDIDFCADHFQRIMAMAEGKILLDGTSREVLGQEDVLAATYVDPPQITRLGKELGLSSTLISQDDLLAELKKHADAR